MTQSHILIVEDESAIAKVLMLYCEQAGFTVKHLDNGSKVIDYVKTNDVDVILLDLMLPGVDGITLCRKIRQFSDVAILMITAKTEEADHLLGLDIGADDYICKPFSSREVIARIKTILRRIDGPSYSALNRSGFALNSNNFELELEGILVELTPVEFKIFEVLFRNANRVFTRNDILNCAYNDTVDLIDRNIDTHIKNIRKKLKKINPSTNVIQSIYGVGYKFME